MDKLETPEWFFVWTGKRGYITTVCGWTKKDVIREAEKTQHSSWEKIYKRGGRVYRCRIEIL